MTGVKLGNSIKGIYQEWTHFKKTKKTGRLVLFLTVYGTTLIVISGVFIWLFNGFLNTNYYNFFGWFFIISFLGSVLIAVFPLNSPIIPMGRMAGGIKSINGAIVWLIIGFETIGMGIIMIPALYYDLGHIHSKMILRIIWMLALLIGGSIIFWSSLEKFLFYLNKKKLIHKNT